MIKQSLKAVVDETILKKTVLDLVWPDCSLECIEVKDMSGKGGGRVYLMTNTKENLPQSKVILKIMSSQSASELSSARISDAVKLFQKHKLYPDHMFIGEDWSIDKFVGDSVALNRFAFDDSRAPPDELAKLMARIHSIPTEWYENHRQKVIARDPRISYLLSSAPAYSHVWNPFGFGLENGCVFMGGGNPNPSVAKEVMDRQIKSGIFNQFMSMECFYPVTNAGKRVVTLHGDFKTDNILLSPSGELCVIDFEFTCVGAAVYELGFALIAYLGGQWDRDFEYRKKFFSAYLKYSGQGNTDGEVKDLMLDAEINSLCNFVGLMANIYDSQVPLLRGSPHPTAATKDLPFTTESVGCQSSDSPTASEVLPLLAQAIGQVRSTAKLREEAVQEGILTIIHKRRAGTEPLWTFLDDLCKRNMLRLFGIKP